jgi:anti-anti-sigma regulatory factor
VLRISHAPTPELPLTLRLEGEIKGRWVQELRRECLGALDRAGERSTLILDLAGVSSIDAAGVSLFRELRHRRVLVRNCSLYVEVLLSGVIDIAT